MRKIEENWAALWGIIGAGTLLTLAGSWIIWHMERRGIVQEFEMDAADIASEIRERFNKYLLALEAIEGFYASSREVERSEFKRFTAPFLAQSESLIGLAWLERVPASERAKHEAAARAEGFSNYQITERNGSGQRVRASARADYFPIHYAEPQSRHGAALGFDAASEPVRRAAMERARESGEVSSTPPIPLVHRTTGKPEILLFQPIYKNGGRTDSPAERRRNLSGFVVAILQPSSLVEESILSFSPKGIDISLYDGEAPMEERLLHYHPSRLSPGAGKNGSAEKRPVFDQPGFTKVQRIECAGQTFLLSLRAVPQYVSSRATWRAQGILLGGILLTAAGAFALVHTERAGGRIRDLARFAFDSPNPVLRVGESGVLKYANPAARPLLNEWGVNIGKKVPAYWEELARQVLASGARKVVEVDCAGSRYAFTAAPVKEQGCVNLYGTDISYRRKMEENLRTALRQQSAILNNIPDLAWLKDVDSRFIAVNDALARASGASQEAMAGKTDLDFFPQEVAEAYQADDRLIMRERRPKRVEEPFVNKDGERKWIETIKSPVYDGAGGVIGTTGLARDITEKKKYAEQMELLTTALTSTSHAVLIAGRDGAIEWVNPAFTALTGYGAEEVLGRNPRILKSGTHGAGFYNEMWRCLLSGNIWHGEVVNRRKDGTLYTEEMSITPVRGSGGETAHFVAVKQDVTRRKQLEAQVLRADKMAAVGLLAGGVAHEINNPLGVILGFTQSLLKRIGEDHPFIKPLRSVEREAERCKRLVQNLLGFSRSSDERKENVEVNELVRKALALARTRSNVERIELVEELADSPLPAEANGNQIEQVVVNLCNNALDAMPEGGRMTVRTGRHEKEGKPLVRIQVADSGQGIPRENLDRIFEPFFTTKDVRRGTGLGLFVVYEIVQKHGGSIEVESEPGRGTIFTVFLPERSSKES